MPFVYRRSKLSPALIGTSRSVVIPTSPATMLVMDSGYLGWRLTNVGPSDIAFGDSNVTMDTGNILFYSVSKEWYPVMDTMSVFVIANSVSGVVYIEEYL